MYKVLTIAASDCIGGAGIQADIKTMTAHKVYAMSVLTALVAENTTGVFGVQEAAPEFVELQMDNVFTDIRPDAVKIGMVFNRKIARAVAKKLREYGAERIVLDPVMVATSGGSLIRDDAVAALAEELMPLASVVTPNIPEAECLCGFEIRGREDMARAAEKISAFCPGGILVKGGHLEDCSDDLLWENGTATWFPGERVSNPNTHGTGCTLSSAIACNLAMGHTPAQSVERAKAYITGALRAGLDLGHGSGPIDHMWRL